jgi:hypothetical protein
MKMLQKYIVTNGIHVIKCVKISIHQLSEEEASGE